MQAVATGIPVLDWFLALLGSYGYLITFGATVLENVFVVGSVTPGETIVMAAAFVSVESPTMNPVTVWIMSVLGTVLGSNISYFLGRYGGRQMLERFGSRFRISSARIEEAEEYFFQHGSKTVLLSRFAAGVKNFVPMIAGISRMHVWIFEAWVLLGAIIYTTVMVLIGVLLGENFERALAFAARLGYAGAALFVLVVAGALMLRRRYKARKEASEELEELLEDAEREARDSEGRSGSDDELRESE